MGWPRIAGYDRSWSTDPASNPIEVGETDRELAA